ncbi:flippase [Candidatus Woesearchaeota archaeon]|nr:flippase [Candidatus Woesearchaeota archaeon]
MATARRIYKNTIYLGAAEIVSRVLQFVVMLYAARILSQEHFGKFSFALSFSFIAIVLADLGINTLLVREISRNKNLASKYFANALFAKITLSLIAYIVIVSILNLLNYPQDTKHIAYTIWLFAILSTFTELFYSIFRAFEMMFYDAVLKILRMLILAFASLYVLIKGYGVFVFSYMFVIAELIVVAVALLIALSKFVKLRIDIDILFIKSLIKKSIPFGFAFVFGMIYFFIGSVMLSKIKGDVEVAIYSVAYNIALAILFIPTVYTNAIYPVLSRYYKEGKAELKTLYERSFKYLYIIGLPISAGIFLLADRIIYFFYGKGYSGSIIALQIIALYLFIKFINFLLGTVLSSIDQQGRRMLSQGVTALFSILLNLLLIPKMGYVGAAWSTFATEIFLFVIYYWYVSNSWHFYNFAAIIIKPAIAVIGMLFVIKFLNVGLMSAIALSAAAYFGVLLFLNAFDKRDYGILKSILQNEKIQENK